MSRHENTTLHLAFSDGLLKLSAASIDTLVISEVCHGTMYVVYPDEVCVDQGPLLLGRLFFFSSKKGLAQ
jgi:hypothetical protein